MPRGDGTGPGGMGPMTGRAAGFCAGYGMPGYANPVGGRGLRAWGRGGGGGRGYRHWYWATGLPGWARAGYGTGAWGGPIPAYGGPIPVYGGPDAAAPAPEHELDALRRQVQYFEGALGQIRERIEQLEAEAQK